MRNADDGALKKGTGWCTKHLRGMPPLKKKKADALDGPPFKIISAHDR